MVMANKEAVVNWDAQEYVVREKGALWYVVLVLVVIVAVGVDIWLLGWGGWSLAALIIVSAVALIVYSKRPPRVLHYSLSDKGLSEGNKLYEFGDYKYFGVLKDEGRFSIVMVPKKRFGEKVTVSFPEEHGEKIVDMFGERLLMETVELDFIDKIVKLLRI